MTHTRPILGAEATTRQFVIAVGEGIGEVPANGHPEQLLHGQQVHVHGLEDTGSTDRSFDP